MRLHTPDLKWSGKHTLALSEAIDLMSKSTKRNSESLVTLNNDIYSLGPNGPMIDEIHPTSEFIEAFWRLIHNYNVSEDRNPQKPLPTIMTKTDRPPRPIPRERYSGDYRKFNQPRRSFISYSDTFRISPPSLSGSEENLPSTSSGSTEYVSNKHISAHSINLPIKRSISPSLVLSSKKLQTSISLPRPKQRMSLEQIDLVRRQI